MNSPSFLQAALWIAAKDLKLSFRDRIGVALGFGLPVVLVLAFGFIYKMTFGAAGGMARTEMRFTDLDASDESRALVAALRESPMIALVPGPDAAPATREELRQLIVDGAAHHALVIEPGFGRALRGGELPRLSMFRDPGRELETRLVSIGLMQAVMQSGGANLAPALTTQAMLNAGLPASYADRMRSIAKGFSGAIGTLFLESGTKWDDGAPVAPEASTNGATEPAKSKAAVDVGAMFQDLIPVDNVDIEPPARPKQLSYMLSHNLAGIAQMMLMFGLVACGSLLLQERDSGTLRRLLIAPVPAGSLLAGKTIFMSAMGAMQLVLLYSVGSLVFHVNVLRDPITLIVLSLVLIFAITAFGMLISTLARSAKQAEGFSTLIILLMSALGGAWFPLDQFHLPLAGEIVRRCTLTYWSMHSFQGMLYHGKDLQDPGMLLDIGVLLGFGVVAMAIAARAFQKRFVG